MRKGIEALRKRIEKHFADADDPNLSRALINKVLKKCEERYVEIAERAERARREVFEGDDAVPGLGWGARDVSTAFKGVR
jgi:exocyst complex component 1